MCSELSEGEEYGGDDGVARAAAERAEAAEQAQHAAAARAALRAAYKLAEEAKDAAKEAEAVAAAKQYHAAHLSSRIVSGTFLNHLLTIFVQVLLRVLREEPSLKRHSPPRCQRFCMLLRVCKNRLNNKLRS